jgi:hypothetical protein
MFVYQRVHIILATKVKMKTNDKLRCNQQNQSQNMTEVCNILWYIMIVYASCSLERFCLCASYLVAFRDWIDIVVRPTVQWFHSFALRKVGVKRCHNMEPPNKAQTMAISSILGNCISIYVQDCPRFRVDMRWYVLIVIPFSADFEQDSCAVAECGPQCWYPRDSKSRII